MEHAHDTTEAPEKGGLFSLLRAYPVISATIAASTLLGVAVGLGVLPEDWTLIRRVLGGALGGAGCGLIVTAPRILG